MRPCEIAHDGVTVCDQGFVQDDHDLAHVRMTIEGRKTAAQHAVTANLEQLLRHRSAHAQALAGRNDNDSYSHSKRSYRETMRDFVRSMAAVNTAELTDTGQKITTSERVVSVVTMVRAESDVGLPKGPSSSASVSRPPT